MTRTTRIECLAYALDGLRVDDRIEHTDKISRANTWLKCDATNVRVRVPASLSYTGHPRNTHKSIDTCLADIVAALVTAGIYTSGSCCGHGEATGSIILTDGRVLEVTFPEDWGAHLEETP